MVIVDEKTHRDPQPRSIRVRRGARRRPRGYQDLAVVAPVAAVSNRAPASPSRGGRDRRRSGMLASTSQFLRLPACGLRRRRWQASGWHASASGAWRPPRAWGLEPCRPRKRRDAGCSPAMLEGEAGTCFMRRIRRISTRSPALSSVSTSGDQSGARRQDYPRRRAPYPSGVSITRLAGAHELLHS